MTIGQGGGIVESMRVYATKTVRNLLKNDFLFLSLFVILFLQKTNLPDIYQQKTPLYDDDNDDDYDVDNYDNNDARGSAMGFDDDFSEKTKLVDF